MRYVIDSNIIIYFLNGDHCAKNFILTELTNCAISRITYVEVMSYAFTEIAAQAARNFLHELEIFDTSAEIARQAISNRQARKIKLPDNFIAATAQVYGRCLVTRNIDDYANIDVKIYNPFSS